MMTEYINLMYLLEKFFLFRVRVLSQCSALDSQIVEVTNVCTK